MTLGFEFGLPSSSEDAQHLGAILSQCFNSPASDWPFYLNNIGIENFRVVRQGRQIVAGLGLYHMGQWFGGQCVPMAGIAAVGVPPEYRGTGVAVELLTQTLQELYTQGMPISVLYPATQRVYRKVGYEQGGTHSGLELPLDKIRLSERTLPIQRVIPIRHDVFHDLYRQKAIKTNGNLERNPAIWTRIVQSSEQEPIYAYLVGSESQPEGYIIFVQDAKESQIVIRDWIALTAAAGKRLWTFLADHRSQIQKAVWRGCPVDPLLLLLSEQIAKVKSLDRWMLRVINVEKAFAQRGYPLGVEAELHLAVQDDLLTENNGNFVLSVSGGRAEMTRGGRGELQLNVRGLASLFTGLYTPHQLQVSGYLEATDKALSIATQLFAGSEPWMPDFF